MNHDDDYEAWRQSRRAVSPPDDLADRILLAVQQHTAPQPSRRRTVGQRLGPALLVAAASLVFAARIAGVVSNLVFPSREYPEVAVDHRPEEFSNEQRIPSRS